MRARLLILAIALGGVAMPRLSGAPLQSVPVALPALGASIDQLDELDSADLKFYRDQLTAGTAAGWWSKEEASRAESSLSDPWPPAASRSSPGGSLPATAPLDQWIKQRRKSIDALRAKAFIAECRELADWVAERWAQALNPDELADVRMRFRETRERREKLWRASIHGSPNPILREAVETGPNPMADAKAWLDLLEAEEALLPPDPAVDVMAYVRWRDLWQRLPAAGFTVIRHPRPAARFARMETRYREIAAAAQKQVFELFTRGASFAEWNAWFSKLSPTPPRDSNPPTFERISIGRETAPPSWLTAMRGRADLDPRFAPMPRELPLLGYAKMVELRRLEEAGDLQSSKLIEDALSRMDFGIEMKRFLEFRRTTPVAITVPNQPRTPAIPAIPATTGKATAQLIEQLGGCPSEVILHETATPRLSPAQCAGFILERLTGPNQGTSVFLSSATCWLEVLARDPQLVALREEAAWEQFRAIVPKAAQGSRPSSLETLFSDTVEACINREDRDTARKIVRLASTFAILPTNHCHQWDQLCAQLDELRTMETPKARQRELCEKIIRANFSPAGSAQAAKKLKSLR